MLNGPSFASRDSSIFSVTSRGTTNLINPRREAMNEMRQALRGRWVYLIRPIPVSNTIESGRNWIYRSIISHTISNYQHYSHIKKQIKIDELTCLTMTITAAMTGAIPQRETCDWERLWEKWRLMKEGEEEMKSPRIGDKKMRRGHRGSRREYREQSSMRSERGLEIIMIEEVDYHFFRGGLLWITLN